MGMEQTRQYIQEMGPVRRGLMAIGLAVGAAVLTGCGPNATEHEPSTTPAVTAEATPIPGVTAEPSPSPSDTPEATASATAEGLKDPVSLHRALMVMSTFEYSQLELEYGGAHHLKDGRGITAGFFGACSGTGDMLLVIQDYTDKVGDNPLSEFIPRLEEIDKKYKKSNWEKPVGDISGLDGLIGAWNDLADDKKFRKSQEDVYTELYLEPALKRAHRIRTADGEGIHSAVGQLILMDTAVQHGDGEDADSLKAIISETNRKVTDMTPPDEYLSKFLKIRKAHLKNPANKDTRDEWRESTPRVDALQQILASGNEDLKGPLKFDVYPGDHYEVPAA